MAKRSFPNSTDSHASAIADRIVREIEVIRHPERAAAEKRYLKSELTFTGASLPELRTIVRSTKHEDPPIDRATLLHLTTLLWTRPSHERRMATVLLLEQYAPMLEPADVPILERLIRESKTWAYVDELAIAIVGSVVERYPVTVRTLDRWAKDPDFWVRRSALLTLLRPLRRGEGDFERFARYADAMLQEREFFIRKAIGWVLRETGKKRPDLIYEWLRPRIARASGVTVREAVRWLKPRQRDALLAAYRSAAGRGGASGRAPR